MNSLRALTRATAPPCSVRQWASQRKIRFPASLRQVMRAYTPTALWGFADLHAHPASHLAFGANAEGQDGILHGNPSNLPVEVAKTTIAFDLPPCDGVKHSGFDIDVVRSLERTLVIGGAEHCDAHDPAGWPTYTGWPHASRVSHQQMHISFVHRAWQGGLRLMIASVADNELIAHLWNHGAGAKYPYPNPQFDVDSARRQLAFIYQQARANASWMQIVTTPAEARKTIGENKLAVILGVEMDSLTADQILELKTVLGVRQVVPIHLVNNSFGGVAVYDDLFNTNNWYLNGKQRCLPTDKVDLRYFFKVQADPNLSFRLDKVQYVCYIPLDLIPDDIPLPLPPNLPSPVPAGAIVPLYLGDNEVGVLGYRNTLGNSDDRCGHQNQAGLNPDGGRADLLRLMKAGMIIDLAHMSYQSQVQALELAQQYGYPLVNTHTSMRPDHWQAETSERDIPEQLVTQLSRGGGVIGLGTTGRRDSETHRPIGGDQLAQWIERYWEMWGAMEYRGVGLGTDTNGLSPQIPGSREQPGSIKPIDYDHPGLDRSTLGPRVFDFSQDGLAHYGLLSDFLYALRQYEAGADIADNLLFHTASDTIDMWERIEQAAARIP